MVMKTSDFRVIGKGSRLPALIIGSAMTILAASAMSSSANADPVSPPDPNIQTLGGPTGTSLPVGNYIAQTFMNPGIHTQAGEEGDTQDPGPTEPYDNTQPPDENVSDIQVAADQVPEPGVIGLFGAGLLALGVMRRRRRG